MSTYRIPKSEIDSRKWRLFYGLLWGVGLGTMLYAQQPTGVFVPIIVGTIFGFMMVLLNWWQQKAFFAWAPDHLLQIESGKMISIDPGSRSEVEIESIDKVIVNMRKDKISSIVIERSGLKERFPQYEDLNQLLVELEKVVGTDRIERRKWLHV